jgi:hypothetical protein
VIDDIVAFVTARLDDREAGAHVVKHDPARVLREVAAKRQIIAAVTAEPHDYNDDDPWYSCALAVAPGETEPGSVCCNDTKTTGQCDCGRDRRVLAILRPLASIDRDHPDYRREWAAGAPGGLLMLC